MIGALIALLLSWALLHFIEHQSLEVLGFRPTPRRLRLVGSGFLLTAVFMGVYYLAEAVGWRSPYHLNPRFSGGWLLLFLSMGWMGYALARSYVVTGSILVPLALHYASNLIGADVFGDSSQLFVHAPGVHPSTIVVLLLLTIHNFAYPLVVLWWLKNLKIKKQR